MKSQISYNKWKTDSSEYIKIKNSWFLKKPHSQQEDGVLKKDACNIWNWQGINT